MKVHVGEDVFDRLVWKRKPFGLSEPIINKIKAREVAAHLREHRFRLVNGDDTQASTQESLCDEACPRPGIRGKLSGSDTREVESLFAHILRIEARAHLVPIFGHLIEKLLTAHKLFLRFI